MKKYVQVFKLSLLSSLEYKVYFLFSILGAFLPIVIQYFMWRSIFEASEVPIVFGYTFQQMFMYTVFSAMISKIISSGIQFEISNDIKYGQFSSFLYRPASYTLYKVSSYLGGKAVYLLLSFLIIYSVLITFQIDIATSGIRLLVFASALLFSFVLNFLIYHIISSLSFWLDEIWYFYFAMGFLITLLSGGIFPLDIFGDTVSLFASFLPFKYTIFFPVNIINGRYDMYEIITGLSLQFIWIVILYMVSRICWGLGNKKYSAVGG
ncbi:ABC transporter permease [Paenibacillus guangzhouensis]|uniref:ABC transporter permease n=1 Tax=Paenibacillus guangzhouensis TaxID=1473112 RepID=UPI001266B4EA|nr:ABC-2 family transporter protein [Paenibacillus guangzhouensis]